MRHRYNTRFQVKKAAEAKNAKKAAKAEKAAESTFPFTRESLCATPVHHTVSSEKNNEINMIQPLLASAADILSSRFHRITAALRLFHYLEHHHYLLRNYQIFRESVLRKIEEFIRIVKEDQKILDTLQISQDTYYKEMCRNTSVAELLMDSCIRVRTIIQNFK